MAASDEEQMKTIRQKHKTIDENPMLDKRSLSVPYSLSLRCVVFFCLKMFKWNDDGMTEEKQWNRTNDKQVKIARAVSSFSSGSSTGECKRERERERAHKKELKLTTSQSRNGDE